MAAEQDSTLGNMMASVVEELAAKLTSKIRKKTSTTMTPKAVEKGATKARRAVKRGLESPKEKDEAKKPKVGAGKEEENSAEKEKEDDFVFSETMLNEFDATDINFTST